MVGRPACLIFLTIAGCSNGESSPPNPVEDPCAEQGCTFPYSSWDGSSPAVSLRDDLLADRSSDRPGGGVFRRACSASSCHGETPKAGLFIAPPSDIPLTEEHADQLLAAVLRKALTIPSMDIVEPRDPERSFLMRKIDGCFDDIAGECTPIEPNAKHTCGDRMPQGLQPLCADERDMIRRWIAQGAVP